MEGPRSTRWLAAVLAIAWTGACASDQVRVDGRIAHTKLGFSVVAPGEGWRAVTVDGAWLAYENENGALMSLQTRCFRRFLNAQLRARHLLIGVEQRQIRRSGPVAVGPWGGWSQTLDVGQNRTVALKTVTLLVESCAYDWLLTARRDFEALEPGFDAWWQSFERPPAGVRR